MKPAFALLCLSALSAAPGFSQPAPACAEFEVASIKPAPPLADTERNVAYGRRIDGAQVHFLRSSLRDGIRVAWRVKDYQIEAPAWLAAARFDIDAKVPSGCKQDQIPEMLQSLLLDRFALKLRRASKVVPAYALTVRGPLKMQESPPAEAQPSGKAEEVKVSGGAGLGAVIEYGGGSYFALPRYRMEAHNLTMASFADTLGRLTDRPVVDATGLSARYSFTLDLSGDDYDAIINRGALAAGVALSQKDLMEMAAAGDPLPATLRRLGLDLEKRKAPVAVLVIDDIRKTPTEN